MDVVLWIKTAGLRGDRKLYWASKSLKEMEARGDKPIFITAKDLKANA